MSKLKVLEIFVILVLFGASTALQVYTRLIHQQGSGAIVHYEFSDGRLLYTACNDHDSDLKCTVFREKTAYDNDTYSCDFTLTTEQQNGKVNVHILLNGFGKDKVIIGWEDKGDKKFFKFSIIALDTCNVAETKLVASNEQMLNDYNVLMYDDTFDIIFENATLCGKKLCKMTVGADGKVISDPVGYFDDIVHPSKFRAAQSGSLTKRYFFIRRQNDETSYHLVKPDGSTKSLSSVKNMLPPFYTSSSHNMFGMCSTIQLTSVFDTEIKCTQHDIDGNLKLETTIKDLNRTKMIRYMHNVPQGGFVFIDEDYSECEPHRCSVRFVAAKFDNAGKKVGSFDLGSRCEDPKARSWTSLFENEQNSYCLAWTCRTDGVNKIHITTKCFNDTDFM